MPAMPATLVLCHHSHQTTPAVETSAAIVSPPAIRKSRTVWCRHATNSSSTSVQPVSTSSGRSDSIRSR